MFTFLRNFFLPVVYRQKFKQLRKMDGERLTAGEVLNELPANQQQFNAQLALSNRIAIAYREGDEIVGPRPANARRFVEGANPATRILTNNFLGTFSLTATNNVSPFFQICRSFWNVILQANTPANKPQNATLYEVMFYFAMKSAGQEEDPYYNRLQYRVALTPEIRGLIDNQMPFNMTALRWMRRHVADILSEEHYSDVDMQSYASLLRHEARATRQNLGGVYYGVNRREATVLRVTTEVTCFYKPIGRINRAEEAANQRAFNQFDIVRNFERRGNFGGSKKRKMFYRGSDTTFHTEASVDMDCLHPNPLMEGEWCFPMAFMLSQVRETTFSDPIVEKLSTAKTDIRGTLEENHYMSIPIVNDVRLPNSSFVKGNRLILFNPIPTEEIEQWQQAAIFLHGHVENKVGLTDHTSWKECPQAYSDCFNVVIHVFFKGQKDRFDVYVPKEKTQVVRHIYMYCDNDHFHPVIDIRKFTNSRGNRPLAWCDFCQKCYAEGNTVELKSKHVRKCYDSWTFATESCVEFLKQTKPYDHYNPVERMRETKIYCFDHKKFDCNCEGFEKRSEHVFKCRICNHIDYYNEFAYQHRCYFAKPDKKEPIKDEKLFVLDIESLQVPVQGKLVHEFVLMCLRGVYDDSVRLEFTSVRSFIEACQNDPRFESATLIAHNGGGYDYQFLISELEEMELDYKIIPRPSSDHKYISLEMTFERHSVNFIDFVCLIPGSLKGIAQSFQLEVQKGDFPHRFLTRETLSYTGRIPPIDTEDDLYSLQWKKSAKDITDVQEWYKQQSNIYCTCDGTCECMKRRWNCLEFLTEYCWLDVDVLANACKKYRDMLMGVETIAGAVWQPTPIDPFRYLTQSQLAMQIFLTGFETLPPIGISIPRRRLTKCNKQFIWFHRLQVANPTLTFIHFGTNQREYFWATENMYFDCYCLETKTVYEFFEDKDDGSAYADEFIERLDEMKSKGFINNYEIMLERNLNDITESELILSNVSEDREFFFGGRTEVFSPYCKAHENEHIKYLDVCSLYPTICSFAMLPVGHPEIFFGSKCDLSRLNPNSSNPYFGFVRCRVIPNKRDLLGLLPSKLKNDKLVFDLNEKVGMWFTEEIYLAMQCGYVITEIYEVHHFDEHNRSDTLMRGYMESFLTLKQEAEGWKKLGASSDSPDEAEQEIIATRLFESNGGIGNVRKDKVKKNPVLRQVSKIFLNCLWGKFCQRQKAEFFSELTSYKDFEAILSCPESDSMVFRKMSPCRWRVKYTKQAELLPPNKRYNIYLAAGVTAQARCYLHRQMLNIGPERILYCDTDSIVFIYDNDARQLTGIGLGKWTDEYPGERIDDFMAIAPKCYMLSMNGEESMKAKGCIMSVKNQEVLNHEMVKKLISTYCIQKQLENVELDNFSIFTNSTDINYRYATMFSRYNTKQVRCVLNKRQLATEFLEDTVLGQTIYRVNLFPEGYNDTTLTQPAEAVHLSP